MLNKKKLINNCDYDMVLLELFLLFLGETLVLACLHLDRIEYAIENSLSSPHHVFLMAIMVNEHLHRLLNRSKWQSPVFSKDEREI